MVCNFLPLFCRHFFPPISLLLLLHFLLPSRGLPQHQFFLPSQARGYQPPPNPPLVDEYSPRLSPFQASLSAPAPPGIAPSAFRPQVQVAGGWTEPKEPLLVNTLIQVFAPSRSPDRRPAISLTEARTLTVVSPAGEGQSQQQQQSPILDRLKGQKRVMLTRQLDTQKRTFIPEAAINPASNPVEIAFVKAFAATNSSRMTEEELKGELAKELDQSVPLILEELERVGATTVEGIAGTEPSRGELEGLISEGLDQFGGSTVRMGQGQEGEVPEELASTEQRMETTAPLLVFTKNHWHETPAEEEEEGLSTTVGVPDIGQQSTPTFTAETFGNEMGREQATIMGTAMPAEEAIPVEGSTTPSLASTTSRETSQTSEKPLTSAADSLASTREGTVESEEGATGIGSSTLAAKGTQAETEMERSTTNVAEVDTSNVESRTEEERSTTMALGMESTAQTEVAGTWTGSEGRTGQAGSTTATGEEQNTGTTSEQPPFHFDSGSSSSTGMVESSTESGTGMAESSTILMESATAIGTEMASSTGIVGSSGGTVESSAGIAESTTGVVGSSTEIGTGMASSTGVVGSSTGLVESSTAIGTEMASSTGMAESSTGIGTGMVETGAAVVESRTIMVESSTAIVAEMASSTGMEGSSTESGTGMAESSTGAESGTESGTTGMASSTGIEEIASTGMAGVIEPAETEGWRRTDFDGTHQLWVKCEPERIKAFLRHSTNQTSPGQTIFAKDFHQEPGCFAEGRDGEEGPRLDIGQGQCGLASIESMDPSGRNLSLVLMVAPRRSLVLDSAESSFLVQCFSATLPSQQQLSADLTIHPSFAAPSLAKTIELEQKPPKCEYSLRRESPNGPLLEEATLGQTIFHRWECQGGKELADQFGIFLSDCLVANLSREHGEPTEGAAPPVELVDAQGCSTDPVILADPVYAEGTLLAFARAKVFSLRPESHFLRFSCRLSLCLRQSGGCQGFTPPQCPANSSSSHPSLAISRRLSDSSALAPAALRQRLVSPQLSVLSASSSPRLPFHGPPIKRHLLDSSWTLGLILGSAILLGTVLGLATFLIHSRQRRGAQRGGGPVQWVLNRPRTATDSSEEDENEPGGDADSFYDLPPCPEEEGEGEAPSPVSNPGGREERDEGRE